MISVAWGGGGRRPDRSTPIRYPSETRFATSSGNHRFRPDRHRQRACRLRSVSCSRLLQHYDDEEIVRQNANAPVGQSIVPIAVHCALQAICIRGDRKLAEYSADNGYAGQAASEPAQDNRGAHVGVCVAHRPSCCGTFPQGSPYAELDFKDFFQIIERDGRFADSQLRARTRRILFFLRSVRQVKEILR